MRPFPAAASAFVLASLVVPAVAAPPAWAQPAAAQRRPTAAELRAEIEALRGQVWALSQQLVLAAQQGAERDRQLQAQQAALGQLATSLTAQLQQLQAASGPDALARVLAVVEQLQAQVAAYGAEEVPSQLDYDDGYQWLSEDGDYQLGVRGFTQLRFESQRRWAANDASTGDSTFVLRRARLELSGRRDAEVGAIGFRVVGELAEPRVVDAAVEWAPSDRIRLRLGRGKVAMTHAHLTAAERLRFGERPAVLDGLGWDRDVGIQLSGERGRSRYWVGLGNGARTGAALDRRPALVARLERSDQRSDQGDHATLAGAVDARLLGREEPRGWIFGLGGIIDIADLPDQVLGLPGAGGAAGTSSRGLVGISAASADVRWTGRRWGLAGEVMVRHETWPERYFADRAQIAAAVGSQDPTWTYLGGSAEVWGRVGRKQGAVVAALRVAGGQVPFLSLAGRPPPRGRDQLEIGFVLRALGELVAIESTVLTWDRLYGGGEASPVESELRLMVQTQLAL